MSSKGINFGYPWTEQPEALKANLIDAVLVTCTPIQLTFRFKRSTLPSLIKSIFLSLFSHVGLLSTIDVAMKAAKRIRTASFHANEVVHRSQTPANGD